MIIVVGVLIRRARAIGGRRYVVSLCVLIPVVILLRSGGGRRDIRGGSLIVRVTIVIIAIIIVLIGHDWCRRGGRGRIIVAVVRLLPADLPDAALPLGFLICVFFIRLFGLIIVFFVVSIVIEVTATTAPQYFTVVAIVVRRRYSVHRVRGGSNRIAGLAALKMILGFGVATQVVVVHGL